MAIRLGKVARSLNVGVSTAVEYLQKKGFEINASPNEKITQEQYDVLMKAFSNDKSLKLEADKFNQARHNKEKKRTKVSEVKTEKETVVAPEKSRQQFKPIGKIDLDQFDKKQKTKSKNEAKSIEKKIENSLLKKDVKSDVERNIKEGKKVLSIDKIESKASAERKMKQEYFKKEVSEDKVTKVELFEDKNEIAPKKEFNPDSQVNKTEKKDVEIKGKESQNEIKETKTTTQKEEKTNEVFKLHNEKPVSKINVVGHIDLSAINQSTRPKKKSKEEKRKEREEKNKARQEQKKNSTAEANKKKKKRTRINKERVDIEKEGKNTNNSNDKRTPSNEKSRPKNTRKERYRKNVHKQEVSEEDVAKQVKETLARLTSKKGKNNTAKYRKEKRESALNRQQAQANKERAESKILKLTEFVTANELANMMDVPVTKVIGTCMSLGIIVSINQRLDAETINVVAEEFGYKTEYVSAEVSEAVDEEVDSAEDLQPRAPIVTVMGHVDHGKTSLLDYVRNANVIAGEAGGITQHIGAYNVELSDGRKITFLDTPGHEAFTAMRARGAQVTDIAIIIVAADDDVMPQTKEAINHATAAGVPIVFAINKIDKPGANPDKIKEQLANMNFLVEEWGGQYQSQDISAKKGEGVKELLEKVLLEAEMLELKANPNRRAVGSIIESTLDKGRGYVATMLVANGTLKMSDIVLAGTHYGKVKAMFNERNKRIKEAGPSEPVLILGMNGAPTAGDTFNVIETEQEARSIATKREQLQREQGLRAQKLLTLDEVGRRIALGSFQELNVIVKGDVDGSIEALSDSLIKLSTEQIQVNVIHKAVGQISESDVTLAAASDAIIIGFQVRPSASARRFAEQEGVDVRIYSIIYDAIEEVKAAMEGMLEPTLKEEITSTVEVREVFHISKVGPVAGAIVKEGKVTRTDLARLIRDGIVVFSGKLNALKRFKDDVKEVAVNYECGISLAGCNDLKVGDIIETYKEVEVKQKL
jgi:translation initiation factor IF-2